MSRQNQNKSLQVMLENNKIAIKIPNEEASLLSTTDLFQLPQEKKSRTT